MRMLKSRAGRFHVYQIGKTEYIVTNGRDGETVETFTNLSQAHGHARTLYAEVGK